MMELNLNKIVRFAEPFKVFMTYDKFITIRLFKRIGNDEFKHELYYNVNSLYDEEQILEDIKFAKVELQRYIDYEKERM